jgi:hypothetical protein
VSRLAWSVFVRLRIGERVNETSDSIKGGDLLNMESRILFSDPQIWFNMGGSIGRHPRRS